MQSTPKNQLFQPDSPPLCREHLLYVSHTRIVTDLPLCKAPPDSRHFAKFGSPFALSRFGRLYGFPTPPQSHFSSHCRSYSAFTTATSTRRPTPSFHTEQNSYQALLIHNARNTGKNGRCGRTYTAHPPREGPLESIPSSHPFHTARNMPNNGRCGTVYHAEPITSKLPT